MPLPRILRWSSRASAIPSVTWKKTLIDVQSTVCANSCQKPVSLRTGWVKTSM